jgi:hypothetical protein
VGTAAAKREHNVHPAPTERHRSTHFNEDGSMAQTPTLETHIHPLRDPAPAAAPWLPPDLFAADADPVDELDDEDEEDEDDEDDEEELNEDDEDDDEDDEDEEELEEEEEVEEASPAQQSHRRQNGHRYAPTSRR